MYLTKMQYRALWFVIAIFGISVLLQYGKALFISPEPYDFSSFEKRFDAKFDSLSAIYQEDLPDGPYDAPSVSGNHLTPESTGAPININRADAGTLQNLPRIGPKMADRIIEYRNANGPFHSKKDLMKVKGIGKKTFENLEPLISVRE
ncbi:MAG: helix-hairpin-helix domain-containing protein [Calditrichia bacterium]